MKNPISWFTEGPMCQTVKPGNIITLSHPTLTKWKIHEIVNGFDHQMNKEDVTKDCPSYAAIKLSCSRVGDKRIRAMMRIYLQVPYTDTECHLALDRTAQAMAYKPDELRAFQLLAKDAAAARFTPRLLAFQESKQDKLGLVRDGFLTYVVWELVPGLRLSDESGDPTLFWDTITERTERDLIRRLFKETFL